MSWKGALRIFAPDPQTHKALLTHSTMPENTFTHYFGGPSSSVISVMQSLSPWLPGRWFVGPTQTSRSTHQSFRFLDLPLETRVRVYGYLVVVRKVFYTPDRYATKLELRFEDMHTYRVPSLQMLCVCKQIREEAQPIYTSQSLFVLPHHWHCCHTLDNVHHQAHTNARSLFAARTLPRIKNVNISFSGRPCSHFDTRQTDTEQTDETAHETGKTKLALCWLQMLREVYDPRDGSTTLDLDFLELEFTDAYCPMGCCLMLMSGSMIAKVLRPKKLRLLGLTEGEEGVVINERESYWVGRRTYNYISFENEAGDAERVERTVI